MDNVLFVLSPLDSHLLSTDFAVKAARAISTKGAMRADLTIDPRLQQTIEARPHYHTMPDFTPVARSLARTIFAPVVGKSEVQDFSDAIATYALKRAPDLNSLSNVGRLFADAGNGCVSAEGKKLGLIFYAALHARTPEQKPYTHLLFPALNAGTHVRVARILGEIREGDLEGYGPVINLSTARKRMNAIQTPSPKPVYMN